MKTRLFYGWYITFALAVTQTVSWGIVYYAFSVFIVPLEIEFGWTRAQIAGAFSVSTLVSGLMAIPVGFWLDKHGARGLMTVGSLVAVVLYFVSAQVTTLISFYLVWAGLGVTMAAILYEPAFVVVAKWFDQRRTTALAVITLAGGLASTIFLPLTNWLFESFGRIPAQQILALILLILTVPLHALVLRRQPSDLGLEMDGLSRSNSSITITKATSLTLRQALSSNTFWWLSAAIALSGMSSIAMRIHFIPLLLDRGFSAAFAASLAGIIGALQVFGRIIYAPVGDRISGKTIFSLLLLLQGVSLIVLLRVQTVAGVWLFVIIFGAARGAQTLARPAMVADLYGAEQYGKISSFIQMAYILAVTVAPFAAGVLYERSGKDYDPVLVVLIVLAFISAGVVTRVNRPTLNTLT